MVKVVVIAGTPVDTRMGVEYIQRKNGSFSEPVMEPVYRPVSDSCDDQIKFQYSDQAGKRKRIDEIFDPEIAEGVQDRSFLRAQHGVHDA